MRVEDSVINTNEGRLYKSRIIKALKQNPEERHGEFRENWSLYYRLKQTAGGSLSTKRTIYLRYLLYHDDSAYDTIFYDQLYQKPFADRQRHQ